MVKKKLAKQFLLEMSTKIRRVYLNIYSDDKVKEMFVLNFKTTKKIFITNKKEHSLGKNKQIYCVGRCFYYCSKCQIKPTQGKVFIWYHISHSLVSHDRLDYSGSEVNRRTE